MTQVDVTSIESYAFDGYNADIIVDSANINYASEDGVLFNKSKTQLIKCPTKKSGSYTIPNSVTSIGGYAFANCSNLDSAYFYGDAPSIASDVFIGTKSGFVVYYKLGKKRFTNPWNGYETKTFLN